MFDSVLLPQVHSDGYISLQTIPVTSSGSASGATTLLPISDPVIAVFLSDVDTSGTGQIYYECVFLKANFF